MTSKSVQARDLRKRPLFKSLPAPAAERLERATAVVPFRRRQALFEAGQPVRYGFVVLEGWLKTLRRGPDGRGVAVDLWGRDAMPAMESVFGDGVHAAACVGLNAGLALAVERGALIRVFKSSPALAHKVVETMAALLRQNAAVRADLLRATVPERIARLFLRLCRREGPPNGGRAAADVPLTRSEIAEIVGSTVATATRIVNRWSGRGMVEMTRERIVIHDEAALLAVAGRRANGGAPA